MTDENVAQVAGVGYRGSSERVDFADWLDVLSFSRVQLTMPRHDLSLRDQLQCTHQSLHRRRSHDVSQSATSNGESVHVYEMVPTADSGT